MKILKRRPFSDMVRALKTVPLAGDSLILPYRSAEVTLEDRGAESVAPTAYYVLDDHLRRVAELDAALANEGIDLFQLSEWLEVEYNGVRFPIAPPMVEEYFEHHATSEEPVAALVDGLHRVFVARRLRRPVTMVVVRGATEPLVPMALAWDMVQVVEEVPSAGAKRKYRFPDQYPFPLDRYPGARNLELQELRYFFYRDLSPFGSRGVRAGGVT